MAQGGREGEEGEEEEGEEGAGSGKEKGECGMEGC